MLKNVSNFYHKLMTLPDQVLIFLTLVDKVVVDIYARFEVSIKHICKDIHSSIQIYEESQSAILFLLEITYKCEFLMSSGQNMFTKGQSGELAWVTSSNIPSPLYLFSKVLPPVYLGTIDFFRP